MKRGFTATTYILHENNVLLIFHNKLQKWVPPGGHIHLNETPPDAAIREAKEETGLDIAIIHQGDIWIKQQNATSIERPYLCLLEEVPEHRGIAAHQHIDMIYVSEPIGGEIKENIRESSGIRWFSSEEISLLKSDIEIFEETKQVLAQIFSDLSLTKVLV